MGGYNPNDVIGDFAERTRKNLAVIDTLASTHLGNEPEPKVFEATQLVNSLLGLLVFPQRGWFDDLPTTSLVDLEAQGWPRINFNLNTVGCSTLDQLSRFLRNGVAHFNLEFVVVDAEIAGIKIWNHPGGDKNNPRNFEVEFNLGELRNFVNKFVDELTAIQRAKL